MREEQPMRVASHEITYTGGLHRPLGQGDVDAAALSYLRGLFGGQR